jgi:hypothetical protein
VPDSPPNPRSNPRRGPTLVAAGLLLAALALVVIYTNRGAFLSPLALVVVAAIGVAALLLQLRLRTDLPASLRIFPFRGAFWLNVVGVVSALGALLLDFLHLNPAFTLIAALIAVVSFAVSGIVVIGALRKGRG